MNLLKKIGGLMAIALFLGTSLIAQKNVAVVTFYADKHIDFWSGC